MTNLLNLQTCSVPAEWGSEMFRCWYDMPGWMKTVGCEYILPLNEQGQVVAVAHTDEQLHGIAVQPVHRGMSAVRYCVAWCECHADHPEVKNIRDSIASP